MNQWMDSDARAGALGSVMPLSNTGASQPKDAGAEPGSGPVYGRRAGDAESLGAFDPGMTPGEFEELLASCGIGVVALTADQELASILRQTSGARPSIILVDDWARLVEALDGGLSGIVLLDMDGLGLKLEKALDQLERRAAPPLVVAASSYNDAPELMRALTARRIHRLLLKPASPGKARLLLGAAINRVLQRHVVPDESGDLGEGATRRTAGWFDRKHGRLLAMAMALVFGAVIVTGLIRMTPRGTAPVEEPPQAALQEEVRRAAVLPLEEPEVPADPFAEQLEQANRAFEAGWLVEPDGENALYGYAVILADQPDHALALEGLEATITLLFTWTESALLGGALELAASTLDHVRNVRPESSRLAFLDAQLERALERETEAEEARARSEAAAARPRETDRLLGLAESRIQRGHLIDPPRDNALAYFNRAVAHDRADPGVVAMRFRLGAALVAAARELLESGEADRAEAKIAEARKLDVDAVVLAELDTWLGELRHTQRLEREFGLLERGLERLNDGQLIAPDTDSAVYYLSRLKVENPEHPGLRESWETLTASLATNLQAAVADADWRGAENWLAGLERIEADPDFIAPLAREIAVARKQAELLETPATAEEMNLLRSRAPTYPDIALRNGIEGWVEVDFVVDRDGRPRDVTVVDAQPAGSFERAAVHAVGRYVYEPFAVDGLVYERRVRLMIRFTLQ
jgi:TonB family protein